MQKFADKVSLPLITIIPRDEKIEESTIQHKPVIELFDDSNIISFFENLAVRILENEIGHVPQPLSLEELRILYNL